MRLALAATLAPSYGIYSGFELCEAAAIEGREEYDRSEKYEIKVRDWRAPGNINDFVATVNRARAENPALQRLDTLRFLTVHNDQLIAYVKQTPDRSQSVIVVVNLDPHAAQAAVLEVPPEVLGLAPDRQFTVHDVVTGSRYRWSSRNHVRLDPIAGEPVHILRVERD
jgi:starch synthase (maltosyl-transferring)